MITVTTGRRREEETRGERNALVNSGFVIFLSISPRERERERDALSFTHMQSCKCRSLAAKERMIQLPKRGEVISILPLQRQSFVSVVNVCECVSFSSSFSPTPLADVVASSHFSSFSLILIVIFHPCMQTHLKVLHSNTWSNVKTQDDTVCLKQKCKGEASEREWVKVHTCHSHHPLPSLLRLWWWFQWPHGCSLPLSPHSPAGLCGRDNCKEKREREKRFSPRERANEWILLSLLLLTVYQIND